MKPRGFTLVELMIVLAIIAIVATLAIVNLSGATKVSNETAAVKTLKTISEAQAIYRRQNGTFAVLTALTE